MPNIFSPNLANNSNGNGECNIIEIDHDARRCEMFLTVKWEIVRGNTVVASIRIVVFHRAQQFSVHC